MVQKLVMIKVLFRMASRNGLPPCRRQAISLTHHDLYDYILLNYHISIKKWNIEMAVCSFQPNLALL